MQNNYQNNLNIALKELTETKSISSALSVCNTLLAYMGIETKNIEDVELSKLKLPATERYDAWFDVHPHFRGDRACFELTPKHPTIEVKFYALKKRSKLFISGAVNFTSNFEDREYTRNDPNMKVGIDFFFSPQKDSIIVALSNKGNLRLVELSGRITNTQNEIFTVWHEVAKTEDRNAFHTHIWESFKLSSLNKKFYEGISDSFMSLTQHLQKTGVEEQLANQFANRLHGRLLFLWFLRKKHIINEEKGYFTRGEKTDIDYYNKILSVLFFDVLNNEHHKEFDPITPYLNGGLFDKKADGEYWLANKPTFPTGFFKNLYDHFDAFNFTTDESTPEYEQIAIDPEMLGRIFESFLATLKTETGAQAKKANGAFYTPREIVSYMSRESLRQYLYTALTPDVDLKESIDQILNMPDSVWATSGSQSKNHAVTVENRERILSALKNIKVLDPAVGSGAFPMGILHKILSIQERLDPKFDAYETKLSILKTNIYGVDIDPTAIEISRLRAWLSLIVDVKDIKNVKTLPNLDFKFVCANSLIGLNTSNQQSLMPEPNLKTELMRIRDEYYSSSRKKDKEKLQKEYINKTIKSSFFDTEETRQLKSYKPFEIGKCASFYDPDLMHGVTAFDVVIGNPPYIRHRDLPKKYKEDLKERYVIGNTTSDIYCYFYELGYNLLNKKGVLVFITSNKWMRSRYGEQLRVLLKSKTTLIEIADLGGGQFESATVDTSVLVFKKETFPQGHIIRFGSSIENLSGKLLQTDLNTKAYSLADKNIINLKTKIEEKGVKLKDWDSIKINYGILTGRNDTKNADGEKEGVFIVDEVKRNELIDKDKNSTKLLKPILRGKDIFKYGYQWQNKYLISTHFGSHKIINDFPAIKEHLNKYESILKNRAQVIRGDHHWMELDQNPSERYMKEMGSKKIIYPNIHKEFAVAYDEEGFFVNQKCFFITGGNLKFLVGLLNSKLNFFYFKLIGASLGNAGYEISKIFVNELPIPKVTEKNKKEVVEVESLVTQILALKKTDPKADTSALEAKIDRLVYQLYDLTKEEIAIVENSSKK